MIAFSMAAAFGIHLHEGDHQHLSQKISVMQVLNIQGCSRSGLSAVGEAHQLRRLILATGQGVIDLCGQQLGGPAEAWAQALDG